MPSETERREHLRRISDRIPPMHVEGQVLSLLLDIQGRLTSIEVAQVSAANDATETKQIAREALDVATAGHRNYEEIRDQMKKHEDETRPVYEKTVRLLNGAESAGWITRNFVAGIGALVGLGLACIALWEKVIPWLHSTGKH